MVRQNYVPHVRSQFSDEERARYAPGAAPQFSAVSWHIFEPGPTLDVAMQNRIGIQNPLKYAALKLQWLQETGRVDKPASYYND